MLTKHPVRVFLLGNAVHERLIPLLHEKQNTIDNDSGIIFVHNKDNIVNEHTEFDIVTSPYVPHNTHLIVLPKDRNYDDMQPDITDSIFLVDDWTFINSESMEIAKTYRQNYPYTELRIILLNSARKTLSTDISDVQTALENAKSEYEQDGFSVTLIQKSDISKLFFWQTRRYHDMLRQDFKEKIQNAKTAMEYNYELHYELLIEMLKDDMLHPESLEKFTRYDDKLGFTKIKRIADSTKKSFFGTNSLFIKEIDRIFKTFTKDICLWDECKAFDNLVDILAEQYIETMGQTLPVVSMNGLNENWYHKFMLDTKFNVIFVQQSSFFFNDKVRNNTKLYINGILDKMEGFL